MRHRTWTAFLASAPLLLSACGQQEAAVQRPEPAAEGEEGQARPGEPQEVATGLEVPWGVDFLPDGSALVTERDSGRLLHVEPGGETEEVAAVPEANPQGEGGLLGLAVSPEFDEDSLVYLYHSTDGDNRIVRAVYDEEDGLGERETVLDGIPHAATHNGGRIAFGPDGMLYAGTGDAEDMPAAQDTGSLAGKVLRMTPEGEPAPGNPFGSHVYSYGHRNVQGLAWDEEERLFAVEFGPEVDDEVNLIEAGADYGWPEVTGIAEEEEYADPVLTWEDVSVASPSGGAVAEGHLWVAALRGERLWRAPLNGGADAVGEPEDFYVEEYGRLRTVVSTPDGDALWVMTSNHDIHGEPVEEDDRILRIDLS